MKKRNLLTIPPLLIMTMALTACDNGNKTLVESDIGKMTSNDLVQKMDSQELTIQSFNILLEDILKDKYGKKVNEKLIRQTIKAEIKQYGGKDKFQELLKKQNGTTIKKYTDDKLKSAYEKAMLEDKVKVTAKDVQKNVRSLSDIYVPIKGSNETEGYTFSEAEKKAEDLKEQLDKSEQKFEKMLDKPDQKAGIRSSNGYIIRGEGDPKLEKAAFNLKDGFISDVIKTSNGYHLIKVKEIGDDKRIISELKDRIRQLKVQKNPDSLKTAYQQLMKEYHVKYTDEANQKLFKSFIKNTNQ